MISLEAPSSKLKTESAMLTLPFIPDTILADATDTIFDWTGTIRYMLTGNRSIDDITVQYDASLLGPGITHDHVSRLMATEDFWYSMPITEQGYQLLGALRELPQMVMIVTSLPPRTSTREARRAAAIAKVMITERLSLPVCVVADAVGVPWHETKAMMAGPRKVLIDDSQRNVEAFTEAGGQAVLVPRPWNNATGDPVDLLRFLCEPIEGVDLPLPRVFENVAMHGEHV